MNPNILVQWFNRRGYNVLRTRSSYWVNIFNHVYQAIPYHWVIEPSDEELSQLFKKHKAIALRYSAPIESYRGVVSYHIVYQKPEYSLNVLTKQNRKNVRKAERLLQIQPISFPRLAAEGYLARKDTLERQNRAEVEDRRWWTNLCLSSDGLPGFQAWAAFCDNQPVASLITYTCDNCWSILYQQSRTDYLQTKVNNFLVYRFTSEVLNQSPENWIFSGMESLDAPKSLDDFKFGLGYESKPVRQAVLIHPILSPWINQKSYHLLTGIKHLLPRSSTLAKAEGMTRFFLNSRRSGVVL